MNQAAWTITLIITSAIAWAIGNALGAALSGLYERWAYPAKPHEYTQLQPSRILLRTLDDGTRMYATSHDGGYPLIEAEEPGPCHGRGTA